jgi:hypothetical protein
VFIPDGAVAEPQLIYITAENEKALKEVAAETNLFRMEGLDKYAVVGLDADMVKEAGTATHYPAGKCENRRPTA